MILNIGCGEENYGDIRADISRSNSTNIICDADTPLPFKDEVFDEVYSRCLFEHLKNPHLFLREVKRILKRGGKAILITDNASYLRFHISRKFLIKIGWRHGGEYCAMNPLDKHYALYQLEHIKNHFDMCGLKIIELKLISYRGDEKPSKKMDKLIKFFLGENLALPRIKVVAIKV
jgi:ubiquinone/menaquinone biosynthesis C-methylase UbiE